MAGTHPLWEDKPASPVKRLRVASRQTQLEAAGAAGCSLTAFSNLEARGIGSAAAATAARAAREALVAEGLALLRAELPGLVRRQRQLQREWQALQTRCETVDRRLGQQRFTEAAWPFVMAADAQFDGFVRYLRESYGLALD